YLDSDRRAIVEFAIEDKRALKQLEHSKKKQIEKKKEMEVQKDIEKSHKGGRGARQRAARRKRAEEMVAADDGSDAAADKAEAPKVATEANEAATGSGSPRKKLGPAARRRARRKEQKEEKRKEKAPSSDLADDRHELERLAQA
ncbi:hypothetical protein FOZ63_015598, partial [Perkinsus olseni]